MGLKSRVEGKSIPKSQEAKRQKRPAEESTGRTQKKGGLRAAAPPQVTRPLFSDLVLSDELKQVLVDLHIEQMTPFQAECVPLLLQGKDVLATADAGAGRCIAYLVPLIARLQGLSPEEGTRVIVVTPTRESALQTCATAKQILKGLGISCGVVMDGTNQDAEESRLAKHIVVLVATPQRLLSHLLTSRGFRYQKLACLVVDGAEMMLKKGEAATLAKVLEKLPSDRQNVVLAGSATQELDDMFSSVLQTPTRLTLATVPTQTQEWQQGYTVVEADRKFLLLTSFLRKNIDKKVVVFFSTCASVKYFAEMLPTLGFPVSGIHGMQKDAKRDAVFADFCSAPTGTFLCTDLVARGLQLPEVHWVIHYDPPEDLSEFCMRIGRTARADLTAKTLLFLLPSELAFLERLQTSAGKPFEYHFAPNKLVNIQSHYEKILDRNYHLHVAARAAHRAFILAYAAHIDKDVFDVNKLDLMKVGKSFGFPVAPRVNFTKLATPTSQKPQSSEVSGREHSDEESK